MVRKIPFTDAPIAVTFEAAPMEQGCMGEDASVRVGRSECEGSFQAMLATGMTFQEAADAIRDSGLPFAGEVVSSCLVALTAENAKVKMPTMDITKISALEMLDLPRRLGLLTPGDDRNIPLPHEWEGPLLAELISLTRKTVMSQERQRKDAVKINMVGGALNNVHALYGAGAANGLFAKLEGRRFAGMLVLGPWVDYLPSITVDKNLEVRRPKSGGHWYAPNCDKIPNPPDYAAPELVGIAPGLQVGGSLLIGKAPKLTDIGNGLRVGGAFALVDVDVAQIPSLAAGSLSITNAHRLESLSDGLEVRTLEITLCPALREIPPGLKVDVCALAGLDGLERIAAGSAFQALKITSCPQLRTIEAGVVVGHNLDVFNADRLDAVLAAINPSANLSLVGCKALADLPVDLKVNGLTLSYSNNLSHLPEGLVCGHLTVSGHEPWLNTLPDGVGGISTSDPSWVPWTREAWNAAHAEGRDVREQVEATLGPSQMRHSHRSWGGRLANLVSRIGPDQALVHGLDFFHTSPEDGPDSTDGRRRLADFMTDCVILGASLECCRECVSQYGLTPQHFRHAGSIHRDTKAVAYAVVGMIFPRETVLHHLQEEGFVNPERLG